MTKQAIFLLSAVIYPWFVLCTKVTQTCTCIYISVFVTCLMYFTVSAGSVIAVIILQDCVARLCYKTQNEEVDCTLRRMKCSF
uniref:Secreted protein n=1 Tax=Rhipicephalus microplus TaxID=6941 RepID=A0A6M2DAU2_RHIMP